MRNNLYICNANPQMKTTLTAPISGSNFGTHYNCPRYPMKHLFVTLFQNYIAIRLSLVRRSPMSIMPDVLEKGLRIFMEFGTMEINISFLACLFEDLELRTL